MLCLDENVNFLASVYSKFRGNKVMKRLVVSPFSSQSSLSMSQKDFWLSWNISL